MDFQFKKLAWLMPSVIALALTGCGGGGSSNNDDSTSEPGATSPSFELLLSTADDASAKSGAKATLADFQTYNLHIWNSDECGNIADKSMLTIQIASVNAATRFGICR